jgi:membrane dipeptidase
MPLRVDAHLDIAWSALAERRGFDQSTAPGYLVNRNSLVEAAVGIVFATIYCAPSTSRVVRSPLAYSTPREANLVAQAQLGYYRSLSLPLITDQSTLARHVGDWRPGQLAAVLLMEGADPIESPKQVADWASSGVRIIGPAWEATRYSGAEGMARGLTPLGRQLLQEMARCHLILDLSHLSDRAVQDVFRVWSGPVMASHSNARALTPGPRQLTDATIAEVALRGGVIGVSFYREHLRTDGRTAGLDDVVDQIDHIARAAGNTSHVGLGTDSDGLFAAADSALGKLSDLETLEAKLLARFSKTQVAGIMGENWIRFLKSSLP